MPNKVERVKTAYPGVYYIMGKATDGRPERIYYIFYRKGGKQIEEKAGRQFQNDMTPARASQLRTRRIEGAPSNQERRDAAPRPRGMDPNPPVGRIQRPQAHYQGAHG